MPAWPTARCSTQPDRPGQRLHIVCHEVTSRRLSPGQLPGCNLGQRAGPDKRAIHGAEPVGREGMANGQQVSSSQDTVPAGQSVTLSWDVSNATQITLQPEIGTIAASGTRSVTPSITTTYKIIASNDAGSTTREISVSVGAAVSGAPDLVITDVWLEGCMIYYKIKNIGTADSPATTTYIYVDNLFPPMGGTSFVDVLKPGQEKSMVFSSYQWPWCGSDAARASSADDSAGDA